MSKPHPIRHCRQCGKAIPKAKNRSWADYAIIKYCSLACKAAYEEKLRSLPPSRHVDTVVLDDPRFDGPRLDGPHLPWEPPIPPLAKRCPHCGVFPGTIEVRTLQNRTERWCPTCHRHSRQHLAEGL